MKKRGRKEEQYPYPEVGRRLRHIREIFSRELKLETAADFAEYCGFEAKTWNRWEQGQSIPWWEAKQLCDAFPGVTMDYIYRERFEPVPFDLATELRRKDRKLVPPVFSKIS